VVVETSSAATTITVTQLYERINRVISGEFKEPIWVTGELRSVKQSRSGHLYIDLTDPIGEEAVIKVVCWRSTWSTLERYLNSMNVELSSGMVVNVLADVKLYKGSGAIQLYLRNIDVEALLGRLAALKARLIHQLTIEGLIDRNKQVPIPLVPLRIGLIASPATEGYKDFVRQLSASGISFQITLYPCEVQGKDAPVALSTGVKELAEQPLDLLVMVRGGGSKTDLSSFDSELVARAIATSPLPVWVGVGHTGDSSVADRVANRSFATPTECGRELARLVNEYLDGIARLGARIGHLLAKELDNADKDLERAKSNTANLVKLPLQLAKGELIDLSRKLSRASIKIPETKQYMLVHTAEKIAFTARSSCKHANSELNVRAVLIARSSQRTITDHAQRLDHFRQLLFAYDYQRQLERGYTVTLDSRGGILREASKLSKGERIVTRFARGSVASSVETISEEATALSKPKSLTSKPQLPQSIKQPTALPAKDNDGLVQLDQRTRKDGN